MSKLSEIQHKLSAQLDIPETHIIILSSLILRAGDEESDIDDVITICNDIKETSFRNGMLNQLEANE